MKKILVVCLLMMQLPASAYYEYNTNSSSYSTNIYDRGRGTYQDSNGNFYQHAGGNSYTDSYGRIYTVQPSGMINNDYGRTYQTNGNQIYRN